MLGQIRQGDILLVPVDVKKPDDLKPINSVILAEGELTGHHHVFEAKAGVIAWEDMVWVVGNEPGTITHPEHDPIPAAVVPPGVVFRVVHQREYTLDEQWTPVVD